MASLQHNRAGFGREAFFLAGRGALREAGAPGKGISN